MCSSPKSRSTSPVNIHANLIYSPNTMARFAAVANAADERREKNVNSN